MSTNKEPAKNHPYLPHTEGDRAAMLKAIGVDSFAELVKHIPAAVRAAGLDITPGMSELELTQTLTAIAAKNRPASQQANFLGGGAYRRYVPSAVGAVVSRSEFATAYTPYQPEVSQGSLQAIYEFQTAVCLLTGMEVANASMYDGPTACAEAALMAVRVTGRKHVVVAGNLNPEYAKVIATYVDTCNLSASTTPAAKGVLDPAALGLTDETACLVVQNPNYFGCLEELEALAEAVHARGALLVVATCPISLGLLEPPGHFGADIVIGDAQQCGNNLSFGGPSAGYMATRMQFVRQLPGRLAGMTVDNRGQRAYTLTLQTREQHIRRANATSNICTNQALNALCMLVYLSLIGPEGLRQIANISLQRAHHLGDLLTTETGVKIKFAAPFVNEFVLETPAAAQAVLAGLKEHGILGGIDLGAFDPQLANCILVAVTEMTMPQELERYAQVLPKVLSELSSGKGACSPKSALAHK